MNTRAQDAIISARQHKRYLRISHAEIKVLAQSNLNSTEFKLWILLAVETQFDDDLSCQLSFAELGELSGLKPNSIKKIIHSIEEKGFLKTVQYEPGEPLHYYLHLPIHAIEALELEACRYKKPITQNKEKHYPQQVDFLCPPGGQKSPGVGENYPPPSLYNNNYNKTYVREPSEAVDKSNTDVANGLALQVQFDALMRAQDPQLPIRERLKRVTIRFSEYELTLMQNAVEAHEQAEQKRFERTVAKPAGIKTALHAKRDLDPQIARMAHRLIGKLVLKGAVKGYAATKSANELVEEVLYYIGTAGVKTVAMDDQKKRLFTARKLCMNGDWQKPHGLVKAQCIAHEQAWYSKYHSAALADDISALLGEFRSRYDNSGTIVLH